MSPIKAKSIYFFEKYNKLYFVIFEGLIWWLNSRRKKENNSEDIFVFFKAEKKKRKQTKENKKAIKTFSWTFFQGRKKQKKICLKTVLISYVVIESQVFAVLK